MSISGASHTKQLSIKKQLELLKKALGSPNSINELTRNILLPALRSQGAFAALCLPEASIVSMSLNTHKTIADDILVNGYEELNDYRKAAFDRLIAAEETINEPARGTLYWYKDQLERKTKMLDQVANEIVLMTERLDEILKLAADMAITAGREAEFNKRRNELLRKYSKP